MTGEVERVLWRLLYKNTQPQKELFSETFQYAFLFLQPRNFALRDIGIVENEFSPGQCLTSWNHSGKQSCPELDILPEKTATKIFPRNVSARSTVCILKNYFFSLFITQD
ncbi:MAG: hypothetical protein FDX02_01445 [Chlorobium sp.]|nr:MAG: hypothetical protein FDX02_01445 [Chlorobium sp.]